MKNFGKFLAAGMVVLVLVLAMSVVALADDEAESCEESSSSVSEVCEESHDEPASEPESSPEPASEPESSPEPAPAPSVEPTPAPAPAITTTTPSDEGDSSSSSTTGETPQWTAPVEVVTPPAAQPTVVAFEAAPIIKTTSASKKADVVEEVDAVVVTPYEPPYVTEAEEVEVKEGAGEQAQVETAEEEVVVAPTKKSSKPWWLLALLPLILLAAAYRPYKVVRRYENADEELEEEEMKSFFNIDRAAKFAASTLDSKEFEANNISLKIYRKNDDRDEEDKGIDRLCYVASADSTIRSAADATDKEKKALIEYELLPANKAKVIQLTAEAEAREDLAKAAEA